MNYLAIPGIKSRMELPQFRQVRIDIILDAVCKVYETTVDKMRTPKRDRGQVSPRQISMYLMRKYTGMSLKDVGKVFNRDHTTVIHACGRINDLVETGDEIIGDQLRTIQSLIR
jgi:chromosomal replication initiator protein